jgi:hypothetical protein
MIKQTKEFCSLFYSPSPQQEPSTSGQRVLAVLLLSESGQCRVLVEPKWPDFVHPEDAAYIREILHDFKERAQVSPAQLLTQVRDLSVGPLITHAYGDNLETHPDLQRLTAKFEQI